MVQQILPSCIYDTEHPWEVMDNIKICMYVPINMCIKNELPNYRFSMQILSSNKREAVQLPHQKISPPLFVHQEWGVHPAEISASNVKEERALCIKLIPG